MLEKLNHQQRALFDVTSAYRAFQPPQRLTVAQGANKNLYIKQPGGVPGPWNPEETPYMVEPMNTLASRRHEAVCFVGPARTGKTAGLLLGGVTHAVCSDPGDVLMIQMTQDKAREFSKTDVDRAIRHSKALHSEIARAQDSNTFDKMFRNGVWLRIAWPTVSNVSGSTYRYGMITDLDRIENAENVDGEGPLFNLVLKRTTTFQSRGMCLVESSPGIEITDPNWKPATQHEGPPVTGIVGIYNRSNRNRWYWPCPQCGEYFQATPDLSLFGLPSEDTLLEIVREADLEAIANEHNRIVCPHCGTMHGPRSKYDMNLRGRWVRDGLVLTRDGELAGTAHESPIAGYWLGGVAAAYQSWRSMILRYLQGLRDYALTGSEESIKVTVNTDQGAPYMSRLLAEARRNNGDLAERKEVGLLRYVVPEEARFLVASVDNQGGKNARFVVQVHAIGKHREKWLIDRYDILESRRPGVASGYAPIDPARYAEDWDLITEKVVRSTYRTTLEGREMRVLMTVVDAFGEHDESEAGVTDKAYAWYRRIRREGLGKRVMLIKGVGRDQKVLFPDIKETLVGGRKNAEKGDIPLYLLNTNKLKDTLFANLNRQFPGPGYVHLPAWINQAFLDEMRSEIRLPSGKWEKKRKRNEAWDLFVYCEAGCMRLGADRIKWDIMEYVPHWARPLELNSEVISREERREEQANTPVVSLEEAKPQNQPVARRAQRRSSRSSYLTG